MTQGGHISTEPRINERIRVPEVRLVGPNGEQVGIVAINDALRLAQEADLDLVEVAPTARPPVCKLMDYGKFKYESALKARESRKNQAQTVIKEIKLRPKIDPHDYGTKKGHVERFLKQGDKVKVTIMFRGREQSRPELGFKLLQRLAGDIEDLGFVESSPKQDGRNMIMVLGPHKRKTEAMAAAKADRAVKTGGHSNESASQQARSAAQAAAPRPPAEDVDDTDFDDGDVAAEIETTPETAAPPRAAATAAPRSAPPAATGTTSRPAARPAGDAPARSAPPRPAAPRPQGSGSATPRPGPSGPAARPAAPRPAAPRATPATARPAPPSGGAAPKPAAPRGTTAAPRPAAPKPGPARRSAESPAPSAAAADRPAGKPADGS